MNAIRPQDLSQKDGQLVELDQSKFLPLPPPYDKLESEPKLKSLKPDQQERYGCSLDGVSAVMLPKPEFLHVAAKPKTIAHTFDLSEVSMFMSDKDDGMGDVRQVLKEEMGKHHAEHVNRMLLEDVDTPAGNNFESLDRLTAVRLTAGVTTEAKTDIVVASRAGTMYILMLAPASETGRAAFAGVVKSFRFDPVEEAD